MHDRSQTRIGIIGTGAIGGFCGVMLARAGYDVPYNGLSVLLNAGTASLMPNPDSRALVRSIMLEACGAAAACGYTVPVDRMMKSTDHMPNYLPSMYQDHAHGRPRELDAIYAAPLAAATAAGFAMPKTEALYQALRFISARAAR